MPNWNVIWLVAGYDWKYPMVACGIHSMNVSPSPLLDRMIKPLVGGTHLKSLLFKSSIWNGGHYIGLHNNHLLFLTWTSNATLPTCTGYNEEGFQDGFHEEFHEGVRWMWLGTPDWWSLWLCHTPLQLRFVHGLYHGEIPCLLVGTVDWDTLPSNLYDWWHALVPNNKFGLLV